MIDGDEIVYREYVSPPCLRACTQAVPFMLAALSLLLKENRDKPHSFPQVDISVAVSSPSGLVVPVLRNVEDMSWADIEKEIAALGSKAKEGSLTVEDMGAPHGLSN